MIDKDTYIKYKEEIDQFVRIMQMSDEMLYLHTVECAKNLKGSVENLVYFIEKFDCKYIQEEINEITKQLKWIENQVREAERRARINQGS